MNEVKKYNESVFESIKHIDEIGNEYWEARELQKVLEYKEWRNFELVIKKSEMACEGSNNTIFDHFVEADKTVPMPSKARSKRIKDYRLSRYACYLIVQNGDPKKEVIALGQTYFAVQTRKQELSEWEYGILSEDEKRLYKRNVARRGNYQLNKIAKNAGVRNFGEFHNAGYKGLYNGETADDIAKRKRLRYREHILDNMGNDELAANIFRISLAKQKIENEKINGEDNAKRAHYYVGKKVRTWIFNKKTTLMVVLNIYF